MQAQKLSVSLSKEQYEFVAQYQAGAQCKNRSEVVKRALYLLQQQYLQSCYQEANQEIIDDFDNTLLDGLDQDEAW
jgi:antitoxin ParD1/3/4